MELIDRQISYDGTEKYLLRTDDNNLIETVLMRSAYGNSVCVSSQAGCNMGCKFCASGLHKKVRDLTAGEMLAQMNIAASFLNESFPADDKISSPDFNSENNGTNKSRTITHAVVMGTGEPFDNYENVLEFCDIISSFGSKPNGSPEAAGALPPIAPRHITVSTCGFIPEILKFAGTEKRYNLAVSLHAPNNEIRNSLMPVNKKYPLEQLIDAVNIYCEKTKRRVTFEYILLEGINDSPENASELAEILKTTNAYVNLIPYNKVKDFSGNAASREKALKFYDILMKNGVKATLRKERGADIQAACGQLKSQALKTP